MIQGANFGESMAMSPTIKKDRDSIKDAFKLASFPFAPVSFIDTGKRLPDSRNEQSSQEQFSSYLATLLNIASAFGYVPFRISWNCKTGLYHITPIHFLRKCVCAIIHVISFSLLLIFVLRFFLYEIFQLSYSSKLAQLLNISTAVSSLEMTMLLQNMFWGKSGQNALLNIIQGTAMPIPHQRSWIYRKRTNIIAFFAFLYLYTMCNYVYRAVGPVSIPGNPVLIHFICYHPSAFTFFAYALLFTLGLSVSDLGRKFQVEMLNKQNGPILSHLNFGTAHYTKVKRLSILISHQCGPLLACYHIITVAFLAKLPDKLSWSTIADQLNTVGVFFTASGVWLSCAEFHAKVRQTMQEWLLLIQEHELSTDLRIKVMDVRNDCLLDPVGVSCKYFTVTYGFIGSMMGLILTYATIVLQMQS